jgi:hypothetical protein
MAGYGSPGNGGYGGFETSGGPRSLAESTDIVNAIDSANKAAAAGGTTTDMQKEDATAKVVPFFSVGDPAKYYLLGLQRLVGAPETGVWDAATHNAVWGWWQSNAGQMTPELMLSDGSVPAFGSDPERAGRVAVQLLLDAGDPNLFPLYSSLLANLGLPATESTKYLNFMQANVAAVETAMKAVQDHVVAQEQAVPGALATGTNGGATTGNGGATTGNGGGGTATTGGGGGTTAIITPAKTSYAWLWWLAGAAAVGGLVWWSMRQPGEEGASEGAAAGPEPASAATGEFGKVTIPRRKSPGCGCGG